MPASPADAKRMHQYEWIWGCNLIYPTLPSLWLEDLIRKLGSHTSLPWASHLKCPTCCSDTIFSVFYWHVFRNCNTHEENTHTHTPQKKVGTASGTCMLGGVELTYVVRWDGFGQRCGESSTLRFVVFEVISSVSENQEESKRRLLLRQRKLHETNVCSPRLQ